MNRIASRGRHLFAGASRLSSLAALSSIVALSGCDAIVGAGDRKVDPTIVCGPSGCACAPGRGDCDDDPDNGCETSLDDPKNCGACGNVCDNGKCQNLMCACEPGFAECDGDLATVCETNVGTDPTHCGACTRDCGGGECNDGLCDPQPVTSPGGVYLFVLVGKEIYYAPAMDPGVWHVALDGGTPVQLDGGNEFAYLIVHDSGKIYWSSDTKILVTDIATGITQTLATGQVPAFRLAVGGGKVYWGNVDTAANVLWIHRTSVTPGGQVEKVVQLLDPKFVQDFAVTPERVLWNDIDQILSTTHDTLSASPFMKAARPPAYFEPTPQTLLYTAVPGGAFEAPFKGGAGQKLADIEGYGTLVADADHVYFSTAVYGSPDPPTIWRTSHTGAEPTLKMAADPFLLPYLPLTIDDQWLYWINTQTATLLRVKK